MAKKSIFGRIWEAIRPSKAVQPTQREKPKGESFFEKLSRAISGEPEPQPPARPPVPEQPKVRKFEPEPIEELPKPSKEGEWYPNTSTNKWERIDPGKNELDYESVDVRKGQSTLAQAVEYARDIPVAWHIIKRRNGKYSVVVDGSEPLVPFKPNAPIPPPPPGIRPYIPPKPQRPERSKVQPPVRKPVRPVRRKVS